MVAPLLGSIGRASVMSQMGASDHLEGVVATMFEHSWWQVRGSSAVGRPMKGFFPGTGVADLAFRLVFRLYMSSVQAKLISTGSGTSLHIVGKPTFPMLGSGASYDCVDSTWVDDTVVMVIVPKAVELHPTATLTCAILLTELRRIGSEPNTKQSKCQVMPVIVGNGCHSDTLSQRRTFHQGPKNVGCTGGRLP